jgi:multidrug resistance efflux pump
MIYVHYRFLVCLFFLVAALLTNSPSACQEKPVEILRTYPPSDLEKGTVGAAISTIRWQLKQQAAIQETYKRSRDEIAVRMDVLSAKIDELNRSLPPAVRFLDDQGRSAMAMQAQQRLLEAQLDLIAVQTLILQAESNLNMAENNIDAETDEINKLRTEFERTKAKANLQSARQSLERAKELHDNGNLSNSELEMFRNKLELADLEFQSKEKELQLIGRAPVAKAAKKLAEARAASMPLQARIKILEEFLETFQTASEILGEIKQLERERGLWQRDLAMVAKSMFQSTQQSVQLETFLELIESEWQGAKESESAPEGE